MIVTVAPLYERCGGAHFYGSKLLAAVGEGVFCNFSVRAHYVCGVGDFLIQNYLQVKICGVAFRFYGHRKVDCASERVGRYLCRVRRVLYVKRAVHGSIYKRGLAKAYVRKRFALNACRILARFSGLERDNSVYVLLRYGKIYGCADALLFNIARYGRGNYEFCGQLFGGAVFYVDIEGLARFQGYFVEDCLSAQGYEGRRVAEKFEL